MAVKLRSCQFTDTQQQTAKMPPQAQHRHFGCFATRCWPLFRRSGTLIVSAKTKDNRKSEDGGAGKRQINSGVQKRINTSMKEAISIDLPVRGTWITPNTPGKKIPSHGTDKYGETYAYDFVGVDANSKSNKFYDSTVLSYLINGIPLDKCYGWGSNVYAPFDGEVVKVEDGVIERNPVRLKNDIGYMRRITKLFLSGEAEYREVAGNYIIMIKSEGIYALFAHLKENSICVKEGEIIKSGQLLAKVGHSGNSIAPHLHFQLMDNIDPKKSSGIPCGFRNYEEFRNGKCVQIDSGIPSRFRIKKI